MKVERKGTGASESTAPNAKVTDSIRQVTTISQATTYIDTDLADSTYYLDSFASDVV